VRGDHDLNEVKLARLTGAGELVMAGDAAVTEISGAPPGSAGPVGLGNVRVLGDLEVRSLRDAVAGANVEGHHLRGVDAERDLGGVEWVDLRVAAAGNPCPRCGEGAFERFAGIEVGHVVFLGTKYSEPMGCTFLGDDGQLRPMVMGCYGIGITRTVAAVIEQNHDDDGIVWPWPLAPFHVHLVSLDPGKPEVAEAAASVEAALESAGFEVLHDDREGVSPGVKFKDADLLGMPLRVTVGARGLKEGVVELRERRSKELIKLAPDALVEAATAARDRLA
jgi:prolyl-tRNA synthetase